MVEKCCPDIKFNIGIRININIRLSDEKRAKLWERTAYVMGFIFASMIPFMWRQTVNPKDGLVISEPDYDEEFPTAFQVGTHTPKDNIEVTGINGIQVTRQWAQKHAEHLSHVLGDRRVTFIHNPTQGWIKDMYRFIRSAFGARVTPSAEILASIWKSKIKQGKTIVHIPHSEGCAITNIALHLLTPQEREKINIIAVAPGKYISKDLCNKVVHLVSYQDFVPFFDWYGRFQADSEGTVEFLRPNKPQRFPDHYIYCDVYQKRIQDCFKEITKV